MNTKKVLITPSLAREWLSKNSQNRKLKPSKVEQFKQDILNNNWRDTHQGIAIYEDGTLCDGQHRLEAISKAGMSISMLVTTGITKEDGVYVDAGSARTEFDRIKLAGVDGWVTSKVLATVKAMFVSTNKSYSTKQLETMLNMTQPYLKSLMLKNSNKITSIELAAFALAIHHTGEVDKVLHLIDVYTGKEMPKTEAEFNMNKLAATALKMKTMRSGASHRLKFLNIMQNGIKNTLAKKVIRYFQATDNFVYPRLSMEN